VKLRRVSAAEYLSLSLPHKRASALVKAKLTLQRHRIVLPFTEDTLDLCALLDLGTYGSRPLFCDSAAGDFQSRKSALEGNAIIFLHHFYTLPAMMIYVINRIMYRTI